MSRFDSENLNAPHTQRHLDEIPQRTAPTVDKMVASAIARAALPDWKREELREQLASRRKAILNYQEIASNAQRNARKHMEKAILIRRELGE